MISLGTSGLGDNLKACVTAGHPATPDIQTSVRFYYIKIYTGFLPKYIGAFPNSTSPYTLRAWIPSDVTVSPTEFS